MSYDTAFTTLGQANLLSGLRPERADGDEAGPLGRVLGFLPAFPVPVLIALVACIAGAAVLSCTAFGRHVPAEGGGEDASRLMGLPVTRTNISVYLVSGTCAGMAGVTLAAQFGAGQPI